MCAKHSQWILSTMKWININKKAAAAARQQKWNISDGFSFYCRNEYKRWRKKMLEKKDGGEEEKLERSLCVRWA